MPGGKMMTREQMLNVFKKAVKDVSKAIPKKKTAKKPGKKA